jgi:uncharacterized protein (TIGR02996 family)
VAKRQPPPDTERALTAAAVALDEERWADAAARLIEAWRLARSGRIAAVLAVVDLRLPAPEPLLGKTKIVIEQQWHALVKGADEETLRRVLAVEWPTHPKQAIERVRVLADHTSPRISNALRAAYRQSKWTSAAGNRLSRMIYAQLIDKDDHAVVADLETFAKEPFEAYRLGAAILKRRRPRAPEFTPAAEAVLARLEKLVAKGGTSTRDTLLAAIYETPHDDAPRMVYADVLVEAGDPRGELITLQLQRAREGSTIVLRRESKLLKEAGRQWFDGLDNDGATEVALARGFPVSALFRGTDLRVPAWATIEELRLYGTNPLRGTQCLRALRRLHGLRAKHIPRLELPVNDLDIVSLFDVDDGIDVETPLAPRTIAMTFSAMRDGVVGAARKIVKAPIGRRLETLRIGLPMSELQRAIDLAHETKLAIEIAGMGSNTGNMWGARVTPERLHVHWEGGVQYQELAVNALKAALNATPRCPCTSVSITGILDDAGGGLAKLVERWGVQDVQIGDLTAAAKNAR